VKLLLGCFQFLASTPATFLYSTCLTKSPGLVRKPVLKMSSQPPNFLLFFTDQQRWDTTGLHGNPLGLTPNFDRLAREGTHLSHFFTCQPVCGPARACLQTGQYATTNGCVTNGIALPGDRPTLAHCFNEAGYATAYFGKWHLGGKEIGRQAVPREYRGGYQHWLASNTLEFTSDAYQYRVYDNDDEAVDLPGYRVDAQTDAVIRHLSAERDRPFFLVNSYIEPHHQNSTGDFPPPDGYREPYTGRWIPPDLAELRGSAHRHLGGYYGQVKRLDEALGRIVDALKSMGELDNTVIVFLSDHGCHFKTRNAEYKRSCHESSIRIPGFLRGGPFTGAGEIKDLISLVDLPPTLLEAAGIPVPSGMEGRSFFPLRGNRTPETPWPDHIFVQTSEAETGRSIRTRRWKYGVVAENPPRNPLEGPSTYRETFLYDLEIDPYELENLAGRASAGLVEQLRRRLLDRIEKVEGYRPEILDAPAQHKGQRAIPPGSLPDE
jgi:arylsulfatase A-like enzyme